MTKHQNIIMIQICHHIIREMSNHNQTHIDTFRDEREYTPETGDHFTFSFFLYVYIYTENEPNEQVSRRPFKQTRYLIMQQHRTQV